MSPPFSYHYHVESLLSSDLIFFFDIYVTQLIL